MRLGITDPLWSEGGADMSAANYRDAAQRIEKVGFDSIWIPDVLNRGHTSVDPLLAATALAGATRTIEIGTAILQVGRHHGVDLAQRLITLSLLSDGRFTLGVGAGSSKGDFAAVGADFDRRFGSMKRNLDIIQALTAGEEFDGVDLHPWLATQGQLRILVGSWAGSRWIERAATNYDGWMGSSAKTSFNTLVDGLKIYRSHGGQRAMASNLRVDLTVTDSNPSDDDPLDLCCSPEQARERLGRLADAGFDDATLTTLDHRQEHLELLRSLI